MATVNLGKIAFTWKGVYNAGTSYAAQDVASYNGDSYVSVADANVGTTPGTNTAKWQLFAQGSLSVGVANGDLIYFNGTQLARLPVGTAGQVLKIDQATGLPVWGAYESRSGVKVKSLPKQPSNAYRKSALIMEDGSVRMWGDNASYQHGVGSQTTVRSYPARVAFPSGFVGADKIYLTYNQNTKLIDKNGQLWIWGGNAYGQCATNDLVDRQVPYNASTLSSNSIFGKTVVEVANQLGQENFITTVVRTSDGKVHACGYNLHGQCADSTTIDRKTFGEVAGVTNCVKVVGNRERYGTFHALTSTGALYSWGYNADKQLGNGGTTQSNIATLNAYFNSNSIVLVDIVATVYGLFSLSNTGNLYFHGDPTTAGQGGTGATAQVGTPTLVASNVKSVWSNSFNPGGTMMVKNDNTLWGCGQNTLGSLGINTTSNTSSFIQVTGAPTNITKIVIGGDATYNYTALLCSDGTVWVSGYNGNGQLGVGDTTNRLVFERVPIANRTVVDIATVGYNSEGGLLFQLDDGQALITGYGGSSQNTDQAANLCPVPLPIVL